MEISLREWFFIAGVVVIGLVLLDGFRRMRRARLDSLEISKGMGGSIQNSPIDEGDFNPELPNGGARIINRRGVAESEMPGEPVILDEIVESGISAQKDTDSDEGIEDELVARRSVDTVKKLEASGDQFTFGEGLAVGNAHRKKVKQRDAGESPDVKRVEVTSKDPQEVIVINVLSRTQTGFAGKELKELFELCGLVLGDMSIFHRHEEVDDKSPIQFSVANAVEPGYFDPALIQDLTTPGVCFFMSLPGPTNNTKAFDYMLETAQCLAKNLDGELKDERRSVLTQQTIAHCRQRIKDFERKQLSVRK